MANLVKGPGETNKKKTKKSKAETKAKNAEKPQCVEDNSTAIEVLKRYAHMRFDHWFCNQNIPSDQKQSTLDAYKSILEESSFEQLTNACNLWQQEGECGMWLSAVLATKPRSVFEAISGSGTPFHH